MATARRDHTATLLPSGQVLVAGGTSSSGPLASAELYDPVSNTWSAAGTMVNQRDYHTATLLPSGKVLVAGGTSGAIIFNAAQLYDPASNSWSAAGSMAVVRYMHTATLLPSGKVLVAGGRNFSGGYPVAELYDPASNSWSAAGVMAAPRLYHGATLLPSGQVLIAGGTNATGYPVAELYDPVGNRWSPAGAMPTVRYDHTATLLPSGRVLFAGGTGISGYLSSAELLDPGLAPDATRRPNLLAVSPYLGHGSQLTATAFGSEYDAFGQTVATGFWPALTASGGKGADSASNRPVFQVQRIDNGEMRFIAKDPSVDATDTAFTGSTTALAGFPAGPLQVRAWVNGVPSESITTTLALMPGQVEAPTAIGAIAQATVNFSPLSYNGGAPLTYVAVSVPGGVEGQCLAPCSSIVVAPLPAGSYRFVVTAQNVAGSGAPSPLSNEVTVYPDDVLFRDGFEAVP
jgi:hypothetical protein